MAFETIVHRWDAQTAAGEPPPFPADLAADGLDEHIGNLPWFGTAPRGDGETLHVHCTDADGEWLLTQTPDALVVTREHAKADVALRGPASDLFLVLLGRRLPATVDVFGAEALDAWSALLRF
jgi:predicted lipid carrier protein YhbT